MKEFQVKISRQLLRQPKQGLSVFLLALVLGEIIFSVYENDKTHYLTETSLLKIIYNFVMMICIPEIITFLGLLKILDGYHYLFSFKKLTVTITGFLAYQLFLATGMVLAYCVVIPFTFTIRFLLKWDIAGLKTGFQNLTFYSYEFLGYYAVPIGLVGFVICNISLVQDIVLQSNWRKEENEVQEDAAISVPTLTEKVEMQDNVKQVQAGLALKTITIRDNGEVLELPVENIIFLQYQDNISRMTFFYHTKGMAMMKVSLSEIEGELTALDYFFKINRTNIINLHFVQGHYLETISKKRMVKLRGVTVDLDVSRYRFTDFKLALMDLKSNKKLAIY